jgi:hypothetical protein
MTMGENGTLFALCISILMQLLLVDYRFWCMDYIYDNGLPQKGVCTTLSARGEKQAMTMRRFDHRGK